jgi:hypothetical protein
MKSKITKFRTAVAPPVCFRNALETLGQDWANVRRRTVQKLWTAFFFCGSCAKTSPLLDQAAEKEVA